MSSGDDCTGTEQPACPSAVPMGWERKVEEGSVCYISPSGTTLTSLEQTCAYLLADGTCKCGLECPLNMHKVFNFDPGVTVAARGAPGAQSQQDMTKLCNHRRKTAAMATLYRSTEGALGSCRPDTGPGLSPLFSAEGHLAMAPSTGIPLPSTVGSFPKVPLGAKTPEATSAPTGTWLVAPPFLQPHDSVPGANGSPKSCPPASPCFGLCLPPPDAVTPPRSPVVPLAEGTGSQRPTGRTSSWAALSQGATGESPEPGGPGPCLPATTSAPQTGKVGSPVSDALTSQSSNNPLVPLDDAPEGRGFLGLPPAGTHFPASSLLSLAAKVQLGSPGPVPAPSTLPPCPLPPGTLLSLVGERAPGWGAQWPQRTDPQDLAAHRVPPEPKGMHPPLTAQPLAALLSLLATQGCPVRGGPGGPSLPLGPLPATNGSPCPGTGLLPTVRDFSGQLLGLFGQLAASSKPTSGTSPRSKASGRNGSPGATASPGVPKGAVAPGAGSNGEGRAGGALGCLLSLATKPVAFVGQEQALALGGSLPPGLLLGTLLFSVALGQHPPACGGDPEGPSLPSLLAASLLPLPLLPFGIPLPALDLLPSPGTLLSTLLPLPPGPGEKGPEAPAPSPEDCAVLPDRPLLFSTLPASLALQAALLATGLGPSEPAAAVPPSSLASPSVAPTSAGAPPMTTEAPCREGWAPDSPTGTPEYLSLLGPHLGSSLLGAVLLGNLPVLSPLLQNQPLPPLGQSLGPGQGSPLGTTSPRASLLQSLQLGPRFGSPEKLATPLAPSAGGSPSPPAPPGLPEGTPSALEPPVPCQAELGSSRPSGGAQGCPTSRPPLKRGRRRAEGLNRQTPSLCEPPSTKSPRRGGAWGTQQHFNGCAGDRGEKGLPPAAPPAHQPAWHCNGDIPATEQQLRVEIKGNSMHLRPSCRGWRRKASAPQPSARLETLQRRGLSASPGDSPTADLAMARRPWPGRPVKNRRRKLLT